MVIAWELTEEQEEEEEVVNVNYLLVLYTFTLLIKMSAYVFDFGESAPASWGYRKELV